MQKGSKLPDYLHEDEMLVKQNFQPKKEDTDVPSARNIMENVLENCWQSGCRRRRQRKHLTARPGRIHPRNAVRTRNAERQLSQLFIVHDQKKKSMRLTAKILKSIFNFSCGRFHLFPQWLMNASLPQFFSLDTCTDMNKSLKQIIT